MSENTKQDGGPAFPTLPEHGFNTGEPGMTLRDFFAAKAMQGMASAYHENWTTESIVKNAYEIADAMLAARAL